MANEGYVGLMGPKETGLKDDARSKNIFPFFVCSVLDFLALLSISLKVSVSSKFAMFERPFPSFTISV